MPRLLVMASAAAFLASRLPWESFRARLSGMSPATLGLGAAACISGAVGAAALLDTSSTTFSAAFLAGAGCFAAATCLRAVYELVAAPGTAYSGPGTAAPAWSRMVLARSLLGAAVAAAILLSLRQGWPAVLAALAVLPAAVYALLRGPETA